MSGFGIDPNDAIQEDSNACLADSLVTAGHNSFWIKSFKSKETESQTPPSIEYRPFLIFFMIS